MPLAGQKALVTGAARGIGRGCVLALARAGADVAINDRQRTAELDAVAKEIEALGRCAVLVEGDAFQRASCEQIVERAIAGLGQIDILISNPAFSRRGDFLEYDAETFVKTLEGTLLGGFYMSQLVARHMVARSQCSPHAPREESESGANVNSAPTDFTRSARAAFTGCGKIVFISSIHARIPYVRSVAYNAAKAGLNHMARTMAAELLPHRINVNVIEPGWIDTPGEHATFGDDAMAQAGPGLPWGRLGTPDDIGRAVAFLCSDDADYITGTTLLVDGGLALRAAIPAAEPRP